MLRIIKQLYREKLGTSEGDIGHIKERRHGPKLAGNQNAEETPFILALALHPSTMRLVLRHYKHSLVRAQMR
jgi:hypothetical protein